MKINEGQYFEHIARSQLRQKESNFLTYAAESETLLLSYS